MAADGFRTAAMESCHSAASFGRRSGFAATLLHHERNDSSGAPASRSSSPASAPRRGPSDCRASSGTPSRRGRTRRRAAWAGSRKVARAARTGDFPRCKGASAARGGRRARGGVVREEFRRRAEAEVGNARRVVGHQHVVRLQVAMNDGRVESVQRAQRSRRPREASAPSHDIRSAGGHRPCADRWPRRGCRRVRTRTSARGSRPSASIPEAARCSGDCPRSRMTRSNTDFSCAMRRCRLLGCVQNFTAFVRLPLVPNEPHFAEPAALPTGGPVRQFSRALDRVVRRERRTRLRRFRGGFRGFAACDSYSGRQTVEEVVVRGRTSLVQSIPTSPARET